MAMANVYGAVALGYAMTLLAMIAGRVASGAPAPRRTFTTVLSVACSMSRRLAVTANAPEGFHMSMKYAVLRPMEPGTMELPLTVKASHEWSLMAFTATSVMLLSRMVRPAVVGPS